MLNLGLMSKKDRKEYKRLLKIEKFLEKKLNKMRKTVDLYNKTEELLGVHIYNLKRKIESKYE